MGIAVGCIGMSLTDFEHCTPSEFSAVFDSWKQHSERAERDGWEQTRFLASCMLQPYSKKRLTPKDICEFSWEKESKKKMNEMKPGDKSTKEQFEKLVKLWR